MAPETQIASWQHVLQDPSLQDLPYKVETNAHGQIVLSPHTRQHARLQAQILAFLESQIRAGVLPEGPTFVELAIQTRGGVKVADVAWMSRERHAALDPNAEPTPTAPELTIEVVSASNTEAEMAEKRELYFEVGTEEVWEVALDGTVRVFGPTGPRPASKWAPGLETWLDAK